jgi:hypothetical protein
VATLAACAGQKARGPAPVVTIPCVADGDAQATDEERGRLAAQLAKTDPAATGELTVHRVVRADLDGDGRADAAFAVAAGDLEALLVESSGLPGVRILQFSDGEPLDLLGTADLDPATPGRELIVRATGGRGAPLELVRSTGEMVARGRCAAP